MMTNEPDEKEKELETKTFLEDIIYPDIEPGIICREMIEKSYLEDEHQGEARRLHQLEPVVLENIKTIRLEFKNILRIDHLWILPNLTKLCLNCNKIEVIEHIEMLTQLKELDLSFNYIEKIENLDKLVNIEVLSLFDNKIQRIENLDALQKLVILSVGNNEIDTIDGIERFRFLTELKVLNLEGNPIAKDAEFPLAEYCIAILPQLNYYEYVWIKDERRTEAQERFYREIREIVDKQEKEIEERDLKAKEDFETERLSSSFVEHLNGHQLYESLWKGDEDGRILMMIGPVANELAEEYDKDMFELTQEIYKLGLEKFEERDEEIKDFMSNLQDGQKELQVMGQKVIEDFLVHKDEVYEEAYLIWHEYETNIMRGEDEESAVNIKLSDRYDKLVTAFDDAINSVWQQLMSQELHLHEAVEESTTNFHRKISEMMAKFVEQAQTYFVQLREIAVHFSENMTEQVTSYIATKLALQDFEDVPPELRLCMEDREAIINLIAGMKDAHTFRIDEREDRMMTRSKDFIDSMIDKLNNDELERHRSKILEINNFLELLTDNLGAIQQEVHDELFNEDM